MFRPQLKVILHKKHEKNQVINGIEKNQHPFP